MSMIIRVTIMLMMYDDCSVRTMMVIMPHIPFVMMMMAAIIMMIAPNTQIMINIAHL